MAFTVYVVESRRWSPFTLWLALRKWGGARFLQLQWNVTFTLIRSKYIIISKVRYFGARIHTRTTLLLFQRRHPALVLGSWGLGWSDRRGRLGN